MGILRAEEIQGSGPIGAHGRELEINGTVNVVGSLTVNGVPVKVG